MQMSEWSLKSIRVEADNTVALGGVRVCAAASHQSEARGHMTE